MLDNSEIPQVNDDVVKDLPDGFCTNTHILCYATPTVPDFEFAIVAEVEIIKDWLNEIF
jgi:hypothetical protein